jgi:hypothetical protein
MMEALACHPLGKFLELGMTYNVTRTLTWPSQIRSKFECSCQDERVRQEYVHSYTVSGLSNSPRNKPHARSVADERSIAGT